VSALNATLSEILHVIGQKFLIPCMVVLILLMIAAVWQIGDLLVEIFAERRKCKADTAFLIREIHQKGAGGLKKLIEESGLLPRQKKALLSLSESGDLPKAARTALAEKLLAAEEEYCERSTAVADMVAKLGPMFGLLGTLIPLGPGIVALGQGDTATLAGSLAVAFDTTISGLISAAICLVISNIRKRWYDSDLVSLEALMECVLEEVGEDA